MTLQHAINHLVAGGHLTRDQMRTVMMQVMTGEATPAQIGAWLVHCASTARPSKKLPVPLK